MAASTALAAVDPGLLALVTPDAKALAAFEKAMHDMKERGELAEAQPAEPA